MNITSALVTSFLASFVEMVEATTILLAVGLTRGWRATSLGALSSLLILTGLVAVFGPAIQTLPVRGMQTVIGLLVLAFGARWLLKAVRRSAGILALRDEEKIYERELSTLRRETRGKGFDSIALVTAFKAVFLEGLEVVFIVVTTGAAAHDLPGATQGAGLACALVILLGLVIHKPLTKVPENTIKYAVGVLLTTFGLFWLGEGLGLKWPGEDLFLPLLGSLIFIASLILRRYFRR